MHQRTVTLYRPVGPEELRLIQAGGNRAFPAPSESEPVFQLILNQLYATRIAQDWNARAFGSGYVTRFNLRREFAARFPVFTGGGLIHQELRVPAEELPSLNASLMGEISVIAEFHAAWLETAG